MESLPGTIFKKIIFKEKVSSTNTVVMSLADKGEEEGLVIIADGQTSGRGRLGRTWHSPAGKNIYMSLLLRPYILAADAPILTFLSAVSACEALREHTGMDVRVKWPNDIFLSKKKLGGILIDTKLGKGLVNTVAAGIGINVNMRERDMPFEIKGTATSLKIASGRDFDRHTIIFSILEHFAGWYGTGVNQDTRRIAPDTRVALIRRWKAFDILLGADIIVTTPTSVLRGRAVDIEENGMLLMKTDKGRLERIHTGDVSVDFDA